MTEIAPLQLLMFRHTEDEDASVYEEAILRAFQGGTETGGYFATGEDLGTPIRVFREFPLIEQTTAQLLDSVCHTVTVVIVDDALLGKGSDDLWDWLAQCWTHTSTSNYRHSMFAIAMDERVGDRFTRKRPVFTSLQLLHVHELGERAIRPATLALRIVHEGRLVLARGLPISTPFGHHPGYLRLFISHAKYDGLPLANALQFQIQRLKWLQSFYDAVDLPSGCDWERELEVGVGYSLIIMLRTEAYEHRYWCQQEVLWAEKYATPAVLVDARIGLQHPSGFLPFDRVPSVRIPDGNLMRILFLALREGLRFLLFKRRVEQLRINGMLPNPVDLKVFSYAPGMSALLSACQSLATSSEPPTTPRMILYPDPPLRAGLYEAANALVTTYAPGARLVTPNTLAATKGVVP
jgi:hypothetical protein